MAFVVEKLQILVDSLKTCRLGRSAGSAVDYVSIIDLDNLSNLDSIIFGSCNPSTVQALCQFLELAARSRFIDEVCLSGLPVYR